MTLQLPAHYRAKGLLLAAAGSLGFLVASSNGLINIYRILDPGAAMPDGSYPYPANFWAINSILANASVCLAIVGILSIFLSKERDEFFYKMRLEAIQFGVFTQIVVVLASFAYFYFTPGYQIVNTFTAILTLGFSSFLIAYLLRYYYAVYFQTGKD